MIVNDLYNQVLIEPVRNGADQLFIVSGYSSAAMSRKHLTEILSINSKVAINLIVGMSEPRKDHPAYLSLMEEFPGRFFGYYYHGNPDVHAKMYSWFREAKPFLGFSGSANYSQRGFSEDYQANQMNHDDPLVIYEYFKKLIQESTPIREYTSKRADFLEPEIIEGSLPSGGIAWIELDKAVRISILTKKGEMPMQSGLNWGQRPKREPNQAYLSIRQNARKEGFLPDTGFTFTVLTDDNTTMTCTVQQQERKAISTTPSNSELGIYFRKRLGVPLGELVTKEDLVKYGRTDFVLRKINEETFMLDFSPTI